MEPYAVQLIPSLSSLVRLTATIEVRRILSGIREEETTRYATNRKTTRKIRGSQELARFTVTGCSVRYTVVQRSAFCMGAQQVLRYREERAPLENPL